MPLLEKPARLFSRSFRVQGPSMEPAFQEGTYVRMSPLPYLWDTPQRDEVVGLRSPEDKERFEIKRVIGLPGECITWKGSRIWVNGMELAEDYAVHFAETPGEETHMLDLGPGEYFVAGDNRLYSLDSRRYGPVWLSDILGRVLQNPLANHTHV